MMVVNYFKSSWALESLAFSKNYSQWVGHCCIGSLYEGIYKPSM